MDPIATRVSIIFQELVQQGMTPNNAAIEAFKRVSEDLSNQTPEPPNISSSTAEQNQSSPKQSELPNVQEKLSQEQIMTIIQSENKLQLYDIFASQSLLTNCFISEQTSELDLDFVQKCFRYISSDPQIDTLKLAQSMCQTLPQPIIPPHYKEYITNTKWNEKEKNVTLSQIQVILQFPSLFEPELHHTLAFGLIHSIDHLDGDQKNRFKQLLSKYPKQYFSNVVSVVQHFLTLYLCEHPPNSDSISILPCNVLKVMFEANSISQIIPITDFYNDVLNSMEPDALKDHFRRWLKAILYKNPSNKETFCNYPFLLDPHSKSKILEWESEFEMGKRFEQALFQHLFAGIGSPYLIIKIRRSEIIRDTIMQLRNVTEADLKKPLKVSFVGEEGIDQGGVQKEFFQIVVRELFDVNFGMFTFDEETKMFWFNMNSPDTAEFELIGCLLGLAIYNSVILDIHFPSVVYKKLLAKPLLLADLRESQPAIYRSLLSLLKEEGNVEEIFGFTFEISYDNFGEVKTHELKPNGSNIPVTNENREEFVELYTKFLLETSIQPQWSNFYMGFHKVCAGHAFELFQPEELELLICGSQELDFSELEKACQYDGGYNKSSAIITNFWSLVHSLTQEQKKKFLFFCTGSDRAPIRGLGHLPQGFTIARNGPDSDRLPTVHTCFNYFLLPEYSTKEKLQKLLLAAIENSEGFGLR